LTGARGALAGALAVIAIVMSACSSSGTAAPSTTSTTIAPKPPVLVGSFTGPTTGRALDAAQPLRVTLFGDSLVFDALPAIRADLESTGVVTVTEWTVSGFGVGPGPGYLPASLDWQDVIVRGVAETRPEVIVTSFGLVDALNIGLGRMTIDEFAASLRTALDLLSVGDTKVLVLGVPPTVADAGKTTQRLLERTVNPVLRAATADHPGEVEYLDVDHVLSDSDRPVYEFAGRRVRKQDLTHLCPDGAALLAVEVHTTLARSWPIPSAAPGWSLGRWRDDARYDDPPGSCVLTWPGVGT